MGKVYREFSRQKYNKYKHQFPKMRESEVVSKILKEWDALNQTAKDNLRTIYQKNKCLTLEDISSSEQMMKAELEKKAALDAAKKSAQLEAQKSSSNLLNRSLPPPSKPQSDSDFNRDSERKDDSRPIESSSPKILIDKTKKIQKGAEIDYITFYKARYSQLHAKHARWTPKQISTIIKLEWKKEKISKRAKRSSKLVVEKKKTKSTGYKYYRKYRGLDAKETKKRWRRFPYETKVYWINAAAQRKAEAKKENVKLRSNDADNVSFNFLKKRVTSK